MTGPSPNGAAYLRDIGVPALPPCTSPFGPGYDLSILEGHLEQSAHLMATLKLSMVCWMVANQAMSRRKLAAVRVRGVATVAGGGSFEVALGQGRLHAYLDLCADIGFTHIEAGQGFTDVPVDPAAVVRMAGERGLQLQFELGSKHGGPFTRETVEALVADGHRWLDAGAVQLVVEARESARGVGLFDERRAALPPARRPAGGLVRVPPGRLRGPHQDQPVHPAGPLRLPRPPRQRAAGGAAAGRDLPSRPARRRLRQDRAPAGGDASGLGPVGRDG